PGCVGEDSRTTWPGAWTWAGGRNSSASTTPKSVAFAPTPSARQTIAAATSPGLRANVRSAYRRSFISQRHHRIDPRGAPGRGPRRRQTSDQYHAGAERVSRGIERVDEE